MISEPSVYRSARELRLLLYHLEDLVLLLLMLWRFWSCNLLNGLEDSATFLVVTLNVESTDSSLGFLQLILSLHFLLRFNLRVLLDDRRCKGDRRLNLLYLLHLLHLRSLGLLLNLGLLLCLKERCLHFSLELSLLSFLI